MNVILSSAFWDTVHNCACGCDCKMAVRCLTYEDTEDDSELGDEEQDRICWIKASREALEFCSKVTEASGLHSTFSSHHPPPHWMPFYPLRWHVLTCFQVFTIPSAPADTITGFCEVLMKHSYIHLFTYCLWLCLCYSGKKLIAHKA